MLIRRLLMAVVVFFVLGFLVNAFAMEWDTDRPGSDFSNFDLQRADPDMCRQHCLADPKCKAWTYVKPNTTQGPNPRCWLKYAVPGARPNSCCVSGVKAVASPPPPPVATGNMEWDIDRPGLDFSNFDLRRADPDMCRQHCLADPKCKAWTYVKPNTTQGPNPRCWLKYAVPGARPNSCCVSGVKAVASPPPPPVATGNMEWDIDRPGLDFSNFDLRRADPDMCRHHCLSNPRCKAWTYVKPNTIQGPNPRCWLKYAVPGARPNICCVSGVKQVSGCRRFYLCPVRHILSGKNAK